MFAAMAALTSSLRRFDDLAIGLSGLCLIHCLASAAALALLASAGGILGSPILHEAGLAIAILLATVALGRGFVEHGFLLPSAVGGLGLGMMAGALQLPHDSTETLFTLVGVGIVALGHQLNRIARD